jgi:hypothetical protein
MLRKTYTFKPVLRGHLWYKEKKPPFKTGDLLRGWIYIKFTMTGQAKSDFLIQMTA